MSWSIFSERLRAHPARWVAVSVAVLPRAVAACPKCFGSEPAQVLRTYYLSTVLLSLLPVVVIGTLVAVGFSIKRQMDMAANRPAAKSPALVP